MDEEAWVERTAGQLAATLADPSVRAELLTLLAGAKDERERQRRLEAARRELAAMEVTWPLLEEEPEGPLACSLPGAAAMWRSCR